MNISDPVYTGKGIASIVRNTGYLLGGRVVTTMFRFLYALILAHNLGPKLFGIFNFGMSWYLSFYFITNMGIEVILAKEVGRDRKKGAL